MRHPLALPITLALAMPLLCAAGGLGEPTLLDLGYRQMYNLEFQEAHKTFRQWAQQHPEDPLGVISDAAAYLYSEFDRLEVLQSELFVDDNKFLRRDKLAPDPQIRLDFNATLDRGAALTDQILLKNPQDSNALFARVLEFGLRSDYQAMIEKKYLSALSFIKRSRAAAEKLLAVNPSCYDAYLAVGVENYMLSLKPAPLRWLLQLGGAQADRNTGIEKLKLTAEKGRYLLPYARLLLGVAALRDKDKQSAKEILQWLTREFPRNRLYSKELARLQ